MVLILFLWHIYHLLFVILLSPLIPLPLLLSPIFLYVILERPLVLVCRIERVNCVRRVCSAAFHHVYILHRASIELNLPPHRVVLLVMIAAILICLVHVSFSHMMLSVCTATSVSIVVLVRGLCIHSLRIQVIVVVVELVNNTSVVMCV